MDLTIKQVQPPDPVLYAINFLKGPASSWREVTLNRNYPGLINISWIQFEQALKEHFMPPTDQSFKEV